MLYTCISRTSGHTSVHTSGHTSGSLNSSIRFGCVLEAVALVAAGRKNLYESQNVVSSETYVILLPLQNLALKQIVSYSHSRTLPWLNSSRIESDRNMCPLFRQFILIVLRQRTCFLTSFSVRCSVNPAVNLLFVYAWSCQCGSSHACCLFYALYLDIVEESEFTTF